MSLPDPDGMEKRLNEIEGPMQEIRTLNATVNFLKEQICELEKIIDTLRAAQAENERLTGKLERLEQTMREMDREQ